MSELQIGGASGSGASLSTRGAARRERMQQDLAARRSSYFLQVQQQLFGTMYPSQQVPQSEAELVGAGATMTGYLEKHGGEDRARLSDDISQTGKGLENVGPSHFRRMECRFLLDFQKGIPH